MATSQYIGARYVPLFAEPAQWDKTKQYEPLTIVLDHGNSYTSRQFVPVGIELTNDAFWALTGNYNAQVEQYRQEVRTYDDRITTAQTTADGAATKADGATTKATEADTKATNANSAIAAEVTRATAKEAEIQSLAETNETDIAHLDAQMAATTGSELLNRITAEVTAREAADTALGARIDAERDERVAGDDATKALVTAETERATKAETEINKKIDKITSYRNVMVVIGDSFTAPSFTETTGVWCEPVAKALGCEYKNFAIGSTGFIAGTTDTNYMGQLTTAFNDNSFDNEQVKYVFFCGMLNDITKVSESRTLVTAVNDTVKKAHELYPDAQIILVGPNTWNEFNQRSSGQISTQQCNTNLQANAVVSGYTYIDSSYMGVGSNKYTNNNHPSAEIQRNLAFIVLHNLTGTPHGYNSTYILSSTTITSTSGSSTCVFTITYSNSGATIFNLNITTDGGKNNIFTLPWNISGFFDTNRGVLASITSTAAWQIVPVSNDLAELRIFGIEANTTYYGEGIIQH